VAGELTLDQTTHPRSLAWTKFMAAGEQPLPEIRGVYKIEGDTFTVCNGGFRGTRPKEFKRGDHPLADLVIFQRVRSARPEARSTAAIRQSLSR
jgi:hypothetical protein